MSNTTAGTELIESVDRLAYEVKVVHRECVIPHWKSEQLHGLPDALYGYMMGVFSRINLASAHWRGTFGGDQTKRMLAFVDTYFDVDHEAASVAIQIWRHKLMHTSEPRRLLDDDTGTTYLWSLHWWEPFPQEQHFTLTLSGHEKILNLGLVYLINDLRAALTAYRTELAASPNLRHNYEKVERELASYEFKST